MGDYGCIALRMPKTSNKWRKRMSKNNYYAVRKGRKIGIFKTWNECRLQVEGFSSAEYKGFASIDDAISYMEAPGKPEQRKNALEPLTAAQIEAERRKAGLQQADAPKKPDIPENYSEPTTLENGTAFVDGSYNIKTKIFGFGGFVVKDGFSYFFSGSGSDPEMASMRNVAGEISGAMEAVRMAEKLSIKDLTICYDYTGIENWAMGRWKCNKTGTANYAAFMKEARTRLNIKFKKVKAHTGIPGNEKADELAKYAAGVT